MYKRQTQELTQRTIDLERTVRQYIVLNDPALLERFDESVGLSIAAVKRLEQTPNTALGSLPNDWLQAIDMLSPVSYTHLDVYKRQVNRQSRDFTDHSIRSTQIVELIGIECIGQQSR